jgi:cation transport regulator ChaB
MEPKKIQSIRDYLQEHFPSADHADKDDFDRKGHMFSITTEKHVMIASISRELIEDNNSERIISILGNINIISLLNNNPKSIVVVRSSGIKIEPKN